MIKHFLCLSLIIAIIHSLEEKSNRLVWKLCILVGLGSFEWLKLFFHSVGNGGAHVQTAPPLHRARSLVRAHICFDQEAPRSLA